MQIYPRWHDIVCLMVFNGTFNNASVISWQSVLLVEETRVQESYSNIWEAVVVLIVLVVGFTTTYAISAYHH
jgi:hypothetical protein